MSRESLVALVLRVPLALLVRREREEPLVSRELPDLLAFVEPEELLELVVFLVWVAELAQWVCLAQEVPLVLVDPVDPLVMLAVLVRLV